MMLLFVIYNLSKVPTNFMSFNYVYFLLATPLLCYLVTTHIILKYHVGVLMVYPQKLMCTRNKYLQNPLVEQSVNYSN